MKITDDMIFEWLSEIADEEIIARNRASIIEVGRRIEQAARRTTPDREAIIEECANTALNASLDAIWEGARLMDPREVGKVCADAIRSLKTAPTTSPRDTLIEEIAEMVDHMGEGRRLEEYVGAIREMKSGDKGGA